jgi:thymidine phosphorylase
MSKKIAAGIEALVLDIKIGNGAFIKTISQAKELGELLKNVGKSYNIHVSISITDMNQPLGKTAGLWCEVIESIECLQGKGPTDVMALVYHLGIKALEILGLSNPSVRLKTAINDGSAMDKFRQMIEAHGGVLDSLNDPNTNKPKYREILYAKTEGYITGMDTLKIGKAIVLLGGGRITKHDVLDPTVGITFYRKLGEIVYAGEPLLEYYCSDKNKFENSQLYFKDTIQIKAELPLSNELIYS